MTATGIYAIAGGAILALLLLVEGFARWAGTGKGFLTTVVLGQDGRTSTSKTFILLWTLLVGWALVSLLIAGEFVGKHACATLARGNPVIACTKAHDDVGLLQLGWLHFLHVGVVGSYLVLLGIPATAGVAAKGITQSKVISGAVVKSEPSPSEKGIGPRLAEIFSADDGTTDIGDFQYVIFNLITAVYFVSNFVKPDGNGLPMIPDTLLGLTSVSAALYVGKKAVARNEPMVISVFPSTLHEGTTFTVTGVGLADPTVPGKPPQISIDGIPAVPVTVDPVIADRLTAVAPNGLRAAGAPAGQPVEVKIQVSTAYGTVTPEFAAKCT